MLRTSMYACICRGITERQVKAIGRDGIVAPAVLIKVLELDDERCCGRCVEHIDELVELAWEGAAEAPQTAPRPTLRPVFA